MKYISDNDSTIYKWKNRDLSIYITQIYYSVLFGRIYPWNTKAFIHKKLKSDLIRLGFPFMKKEELVNETAQFTGKSGVFSLVLFPGRLVYAYNWKTSVVQFHITILIQ